MGRRKKRRGLPFKLPNFNGPYRMGLRNSSTIILRLQYRTIMWMTFCHQTNLESIHWFPVCLSLWKRLSKWRFSAALPAAHWTWPWWLDFVCSGGGFISAGNVIAQLLMLQCLSQLFTVCCHTFCTLEFRCNAIHQLLCSLDPGPLYL